jgi:DNA-binding CsgD family transcriptional regulator
MGVRLEQQLSGGYTMPDGEVEVKGPLADPLTRRERQVLALLAEGYSGPEIAEKLTIALSSAKSHIQNTYRKLGANTKRQALTRAAEVGLLAAPAEPVIAGPAEPVELAPEAGELPFMACATLTRPMPAGSLGARRWWPNWLAACRPRPPRRPALDALPGRGGRLRQRQVVAGPGGCHPGAEGGRCWRASLRPHPRAHAHRSPA